MMLWIRTSRSALRQGTKRQVKVLEAGGFFGEVALINHSPRAADCVAASKLKACILLFAEEGGLFTVTLPAVYTFRHAFQRLPSS